MYLKCKIMVKHIRLNKKCTSCNNYSLTMMWIFTWSKRTGGHHRSQNCLNCLSYWFGLPTYSEENGSGVCLHVFYCTKSAAQLTLWPACQFMYVAATFWLHGNINFGVLTMVQDISDLIWSVCALRDTNTTNNNEWHFCGSLHCIEIWWIKRVIICKNVTVILDRLTKYMEIPWNGRIIIYFH